MIARPAAVARTVALTAARAATVARAAIVVVAALAAAGCGPRAPVAAPAPPRLDGGWRTLRGEHKVAIRARDASGTPTERSLRGLVAVERPDKFRLRALGPAGVGLFDVVSVAGEVRVIDAIRGAGTGDRSPLSRLLPSMAGDLGAAYDLLPRPPGRSVRVDAAAGAVIVDEPDRTVRLSSFRAASGGRSYAARIDIDNRAHGYSVSVAAGDTTLDEPLDPELFR